MRESDGIPREGRVRIRRCGVCAAGHPEVEAALDLLGDRVEVETVQCFGICEPGPVVQVNGTFLNPATREAILASLDVDEERMEER